MLEGQGILYAMGTRKGIRDMRLVSKVEIGFAFGPVKYEFLIGHLSRHENRKQVIQAQICKFWIHQHRDAV